MGTGSYANAMRIARAVAAAFVLCLLAGDLTVAGPPAPKPSKPKPVQLGTSADPLVIQVQPSARTQGDIDRETQAESDRRAEAASRQASAEESAATNKKLILIGVVQALIFLLQLLVFGRQARRLRETVEIAQAQSRDMRESINTGARAAGAMERLAANSERSIETLREVTALQMRAYLTVSVGTGAYQDRANGIRFDVRPLITNTGNTPALKVGYLAKAMVLPVPLPADFVFQLPEGIRGSGVVGPRGTADMWAMVNDYVPDEDVQAIKKGHPRAVFTWGTVWYEDIFKAVHETHFCYSVMWLPDGKVYGYYNARNNTAT